MIQLNTFGNVGRDAKNETINGNEYLIFDIGVNQKIKGQNVTLWINCTMPGKNERLCAILKAGTYIFVTGQAIISSYMSQKKDATEKTPAPSVTLYVDRVQLLSGKQDSEAD
jgi:hypothetical protein